MTSPSLPPVTVRGIDVSYYQDRPDTHADDIDWAAVKANGVEYVWVRITKAFTLGGRVYVDRDSSAATIVRWAREAGLLLGAYHYHHPAADPALQARTMLAAVSDLGRPELGLAADCEEHGRTPKGALTDHVLALTDPLADALNRPATLYTTPSMAREYLDSKRLAHMPLWISHVGVSRPIVPAPWAAWTYWQHSWKGRVPGILTNVDLDLYAGSLEQLRAANGVSAP